MSENYIKKIIAKYQATGRIAFYYPRKQRISLNGGRSLEISEAIDRMLEVIVWNA